MFSEKDASPWKEYATKVEQLPYVDTAGGIMHTLYQVLCVGMVQSVHIELNKPMEVRRWVEMTDDRRIEDMSRDMADVVEHVQLDEIIGVSGAEALFQGMLKLTLDQLQPSFVVTGSIEAVRDRLNIPRVVTLPRLNTRGYLGFLGMALVELPSMEEDSHAVLGSELNSGDVLLASYNLVGVRKGYKLNL